MHTGPDRRVRRTRKALQDALLALVLEKGYEAVTVQDIIDRADVGRSTFYAHFTDKENLFASGIQDLRAEVLAACAAEPGRGLFAFSLPLFRHGHGQRRLWRALMGRRSGALVQRWFSQLVSELVRDELRALLPARHKPAVPLDAVVPFVVGAYLSLFAWWLDSRARLTPEDVDRMFRDLATPGVTAALGL